ncbi:MAG: glycoside hydrolase family 97 protein [Bacteroidales bacterium]|jgi:alpha-glucosidase|nr:glycoside hydrolase family 97 protein [Bacteroidales bacterium]
MDNRLITTLAALLLLPFCLPAAPRHFELLSPDGRLRVGVEAGPQLSYTLDYDGVAVLAPSQISVCLDDGSAYDGSVRFQKAIRSSVDTRVPATAYKRAEVHEHYNQLTLRYKTFDLVLRAYDAGMAWRFVSRTGKDFIVRDEQAEFRFAEDAEATVPYIRTERPDDSIFFNSFENYYSVHPLSQWSAGQKAFLPVSFSTQRGWRVNITESDLLDYPGMYLEHLGGTAVGGLFAPYPKEVEHGGYHMLQGIVRSAEDYIAKQPAGAALPWRIVSVATEDRRMLDSDLVWLLSRPAADSDWSWVKPGKVAWDWWNDWNISGVPFRAGINTDTYKYYIDFAAAHGIEYVILDEGWAVNLKADLFQVVPEIDLPGIVDYANSKGVGIILWAGYWAMNRDIEGICKHFSGMGVKGFKIDFMNRDDQQMVQFYTEVAETAARHHLLVDFHGAFKPSGLQRPYPNVINHEGVSGLEQMKWAQPTVDQVTYDVQIPFIRMFAGPMDYTQGAMRNATRYNYRPVNSEPMSQGTRCRQLAEYVIFEAPLTMLCDAPTNYLAEPECLDWIASVPTVWDETVALDGRVGDYVAIARRKGGDWYVGAMTDWDARELELDLSAFLPAGSYRIEFFADGVNADRAARDHVHGTQNITVSGAQHTLTVKMAPGGGWTAKFIRL